MDWKREAMDKLQVHRAKKESLARMALEIEQLEADAISIRGARTDAIPVLGGGNTREDAMVNNLVKREELRRAHAITRGAVESVDRALDCLSKEERRVLESFYLHRVRGNVGRLREELGLEDERSVYRRKDKALRHFTLAMYGVTES
jgi:hypothetical protein